MSILIIRAPAAAPIGTLNHGDAITFNTPANVTTSAATQVFDYGQSGAGVLHPFWSGGWPNTASNSLADMQNRSLPCTLLGGSTISGPTPQTSAIAAGCHYDINTGTGGNAVLIYTAYAKPTFPYYTYWSWYERDDPNWWYTLYSGDIFFTGTFTAGSNVITGVTVPVGLTAGDSNTLTGGSANLIPAGTTIVSVGANTVTMSAAALKSGTFSNNNALYNVRFENNKRYVMSNGTAPYVAPYWYTNLDDNQTKSNTAAAGLSYTTQQGVPPVPDQNGHSNFWGTVFNPANPSIGWVKCEIIACFTSATTGFWQFYQNGLLRMNIAGANEFAGSNSCDAIGGYAVNQGYVGQRGLVSPLVTTGANGTYTQWKYYGNIRYCRQQSTLARTYATNASSFTLAGGVQSEPQPGTFSNGVYVGTYNKGNLAAGPVNFWTVDEANGITTPVQVGAAVSN